MMLRNLFNAALIAMAVSLSAIGLANSEDGNLTPAQMREDLRFLKEDWAKLDKSFNTQQRVAFDKSIDDLSASPDSLSPQAFALEVARATALARNGHTGVNLNTLLGPDLAVRVWSFADGLYIVKAHPDFARLLGARIDKIGSMDAATAMARLKPYLSGTDQRIAFLSPGFLVAPSVLKHVGAVDDATSVPITLRLATGATETILLEPSAQGDPGDERVAKLNRGYTVLIPDALDLAGRWPHVLDGKADLPPIYDKRRDVSAQFLGDAKQVLYIRNDSGRSFDETPLSDKFAGVVLSDLLPAKPRYVIVDLRFNNGGDFFNAILFSQALPRLVPPDGHVFVLVGRGTFSAGITTAAMLKGADRTKVTLVGEPMGDAGKFWGEGDTVKLPNSQIPVRYSTEFHDYETGCFEIGKCFWAVVAFGPREISIAPDIRVELTFGDYAAGRDAALEAVLAKIKRN